MKYFKILLVLLALTLITLTESLASGTKIGLGVGYTQNDQPTWVPMNYGSYYLVYYNLETKESLQIYVPIWFAENLCFEPTIGFGNFKFKESSAAWLRFGAAFRYKLGIAGGMPYVGFVLNTTTKNEKDFYGEWKFSGVEYGLSSGAEYFVNNQFSIGGDVRLTSSLYSFQERDVDLSDSVSQVSLKCGIIFRFYTN